jgi:U3 small nucleolar RNA-associated protein 19
MMSDGSFFESRREYDTFAVSQWNLTFSYRTLLSNASHDRQTSIATNLLSILENLNTFPTEPGELNSWWVPELGVKPPKKTTVASVSSDSNSDDPPEADEEDDWRKFFDEPAPTPENAAKVPGSRLHKMTIHQSVHSLSSHRAVFTRMWLTLLPRLSGNGDNDIEPRKPLIVKALNIMHRSVLPHLTRPILVMDWVGACVDYGG